MYYTPIAINGYLLFESFSSAKNIFLLKVTATKGSPVGLRSAGKGTNVEFIRFFVLWVKYHLCDYKMLHGVRYIT